MDDHEAASTQITFAEEPQLDDEGTYWFQLDQNGIDKAAVVSGIVYELSEDGADLISLGETYDVYCNWDTGEFADDFNGMWLALPDGQSLNLSVESSTDDYIIYTSPVTLNGKDCFLRMRQDKNTDEVVVEGAWSGLDESGAVDRGVTKLRRGDIIIPQYKAFSTDESVTASSYEGEPYTMSDKTLDVSYGWLPDGTYLYGFCIEDAFGDYVFTESKQFIIDPDGTIYFE